MSRSIGLQSLAVSVPDQVLTNDHWREHYPQLVAEAAGRAQRKQPEDREVGSGACDRERLPYLDDPFRGARERRVLPAGGTALDLETRAARETLSVAGLEPHDIDLLICTSLLPDHHGVGGATYLARELGLTGAAWNIEAAGSSALIAFQTACSLISTGQYRKVLIITSCTHSRATVETDPIAWQIGDAATAMVVGPVADQVGYLGSHSVHTGDTKTAFTHRLGTDANGKVGYQLQANERAAETLAEIAEQSLEKCVCRALEQAGKTLEDIDHFVFSTPSASQAASCARTLGIETRPAPSVYPLYADAGPALLGLNLFHAAHWRRFQPGELVLLCATSPASNCSAAVVRWGEVALGELPAGATPERIEQFEAETLALYRLRRLEIEVLEPTRSVGDADLRLRRLVAGYATLAIDEPGIMTLFVEDGDTEATADVLPEILTRSRHFIETLETHIAALFRQQGQSSRIDPTVAALSLLGIVHWGVCSYRAEGRLSQKEAIEQVTRLALHGLVSQPPSGPIWPASSPMTA